MGYGDDLMTTAQVRKAKEAKPESLILVGDGRREYWSAMFRHNPHMRQPRGYVNWEELEDPPASVRRRGAWYLARATPEERRRLFWIHNYPGRRPYIDYAKKTDACWAWNAKHRAEPGEIYFSEAELAFAESQASRLGQFILVEPHIKRMTSAGNKDWGWNNWQTLTDRLRRDHRIVQVGKPGVRILGGAEFIPTERFRLAIALISRCEAVITSEGGTHHAAATVGSRAVVIFGGYIHPDITGYPFHENLYVEHQLSPCGMRRDCAHCKLAMKRISVTEVEERLRRQLEQILPADRDS